MDPNLVGERRPTIFQRIQYDLTHSEVIKKKIQPGKFPTCSVGILQIIAIILLLSAAISFLSIVTCPKTSDWYVWLLPLATSSGAIAIIIFYGIFTLGLALKYPDFWFISDIAICIIFALFIISTSVLTITECTSADTAHRVPAPLGICGAVFLIFSGAGLFIMYKNKEIVQVQEVHRTDTQRRPRALSTDLEV